MNLAAEDIDFIREHIGEWLVDQPPGKPPTTYETSLYERIFRVEEELKYQRELIQTILDQMEKRFEVLQREMDRRFDAMDKRFDAIDKRFDAIDKRFEAIDKRFEAINKRFEATDKRFEAMDKRFETLQHEMNRRFEAMQNQMNQRFEAMQNQMNQRFEEMAKRLERLMIWSFSTTLTVGGLVIAALKLLP